MSFFSFKIGDKELSPSENALLGAMVIVLIIFALVALFQVLIDIISLLIIVHIIARMSGKRGIFIIKKSGIGSYAISVSFIGIFSEEKNKEE